MLPCLVSGTSSVSISGYENITATFREMDRVENIFECFRIQLNSMDIQFPRHSVLPHLLSMVETTITLKNETEQREFAESIRLTVESVMPWEKFQSYATIGVS